MKLPEEDDIRQMSDSEYREWISDVRCRGLLKHDIHELADQLPMMSPNELVALARDIRKHGLKEPVLLFENKIIDGRNRSLACLIAKKKVRTAKFPGSRETAELLSVQKNLIRRDLSKSQKAMVVVNAGYATTADRRANNGEASIREIAKRFGISHMTLYKALFVARDERLRDEVLRGQISIAKAEARIRDRERDSKTGRASASRQSQASRRRKRRDAMGTQIPRHLANVFQAGDQLRESLKSCDEAVSTLESTDAVDLKRLKQLKKQLAACIEKSVPHAVCQGCEGHGCLECDFHGWQAAVKKGKPT